MSNAWDYPGIRSTAPQPNPPRMEYVIRQQIPLALADDEAACMEFGRAMVERAVREGNVTGEFTYTLRVVRHAELDGEPIEFTDDDGNVLPVTAMIFAHLTPAIDHP